MKSSGRGYTILEVMLFLAITSALFLSAYMLMSGQQPRAQFAQGMRDLESKMRDYINDVSTGYYPQVGEYSCTADASGIRFEDVTGLGDTTGKNLSCIFMGKVLHFQPDEGNDVFFAYNVVGRRKVNSIGSNLDVATVEEATPRVVFDDTIGLDQTERYAIPWGVKVKSTSNQSAIAIFSSLSRTTTVTPGQSESGALTLEPLIYNVLAGTPKLDAIDCINDVAACAQTGTPFTEWSACFERHDSKETARITIGGDGKKTNLTLAFEDC